MIALVALWAFAEATVFFIVADVPIMAVGIRHGVKKALLAAVVAAFAAAAGGLAVMHWATVDPEGSRALFESLPGITPALFDSAAADWHEGGLMAMALGSFSGVPYKLYAHAAGSSNAGMAGFFAASVLARLPRFLLTAFVSGVIGPWLRKRLQPRTLWTLFVLSWTAFYAWYLTNVG